VRLSLLFCRGGGALLGLLRRGGLLLGGGALLGLLRRGSLLLGGGALLRLLLRRGTLLRGGALLRLLLRRGTLLRGGALLRLLLRRGLLLRGGALLCLLLRRGTLLLLDGLRWRRRRVRRRYLRSRRWRGMRCSREHAWSRLPRRLFNRGLSLSSSRGSGVRGIWRARSMTRRRRRRCRLCELLGALGRPVSAGSGHARWPFSWRLCHRGLPVSSPHRSEVREIRWAWRTPGSRR
jgi:hypothetical protein